MAKIVRYGGNLKAFASEQQTNERTLFGQVTIANDLTSQVTAEFLRGWGIVGPSDQPSLQDFNAAMYTHGQLLAYLHQMGVAEYNAAQEYFIGSVTQTGGVLYMSLTDANIGNAPSSSPANWKAFTADQATEVALGLVKIATQALTNAGADDAAAVTSKKLAVATQGQKHTAFTTTGTATAQVLTPVPAITAYAATQRFNVTFNIASGVNPTINVSGQGAKLLKQYDSTGAKIAAVFVAGHVSDIIYDGTDWILVDALPGTNTLPPGAVVYFPLGTAPAGFLKANAAIVSRTTYAALFAVIGTTFGAGDGSTTFGLPDLRAEFIRGWDDSRGVDVGRGLNSTQAHGLASHVHNSNVASLGPVTPVGTLVGQRDFPNGATNLYTNSQTSATGISETRPMNIALLACIKF